MAASGSSEPDKIPVYAWLGGPGKATDKEIKVQFKDLKEKGIDGLMYSGGHDPKTYRRVGKIAKETGLKFHAWIPTLIQNPNSRLKQEWYMVNGVGESTYDKPPYVGYYKFLCPSREEVIRFLETLYTGVAEVPELDGIHLDYIRFPDVILPRGLWKKYGLFMDREYPQFDYCYCEKCVAGFKAASGIDIRSVEDPTKVEAWKQYRKNLITNVIKRLKKIAHSKGKAINAAVFPGPHSVAKKIVQQEWDRWALDAVFLMNYNDFYLERPEWIGRMTREAVESVSAGQPVYSGLFICPKPKNKASESDPENHGLLPEELEPAIRESMENGAAGICLFTPGRMTEAHWSEFKKAVYKTYYD